MFTLDALCRRHLRLINLLFLLLFHTGTMKAQESQERMIDLGGYRLHAITSGNGRPTVVFESGMGENLSTWKDVQPAIAKSTRTFIYDRAGLGQSDPSPKSRDAQQMARELHTLLHKAEVPVPYILVGHSFGTWIVNVYARLYPSEVAGMILVDPAYQENRLRARMTIQQWTEREKAIERYTDRITKYQQMEKDAIIRSGEQALRAFPMPKIPIIVLTGTKTNPDFPSSALEKEVKMKVHQEWLERVPWAEHIFVEESRHYIQNEAPTKVITAIQRVVEKARNFSVEAK